MVNDELRCISDIFTNRISPYDSNGHYINQAADMYRVFPIETTFYCNHKYNAMCDLIISQIKHSQHHLIYPCLLNKKVNIIEDKLVIELD